jgi:hypothetical protein
MKAIEPFRQGDCVRLLAPDEVLLESKSPCLRGET